MRNDETGANLITGLVAAALLNTPVDNYSIASV
jgi:hypothetical protein